MAEQVVGGAAPDVVTRKTDPEVLFNGGKGSVAVTSPEAKPATSYVMTAETDHYAAKANRIRIQHELGEVLAVIELVSPGNKDSNHAIRAFVDKSVDLLYQGINLMIPDPFPPGPRDPNGIHDLIWNEVTGQRFDIPKDRPLTIVSYQASPVKTAYIEPISIGAALPVMPLFLKDEYYISLPLESTYSDTWNVLPVELKKPLE